jgi:ComF family protein
MRCALALPADLSGGIRTGPPLCGACAIEAPPLDRAFAGVAYAYPWSTLVAGYKFGERHGWAGFFAGLLLQSPGLAQVFGELGPEDWLLPIPLSAERLQARGFNQAWELCAALARQTQTSARPAAGLLLRVRHTRPQSQLKRKERLANVRGAFQFDPLRAAELRDRRVLLVDDVMTSGASLYTAAQVLRDAGVAHITAVVLARTAHA